MHNAWFFMKTFILHILAFFVILPTSIMAILFSYFTMMMSAAKWGSYSNMPTTRIGTMAILSLLICFCAYKLWRLYIHFLRHTQKPTSVLFYWLGLFSGLLFSMLFIILVDITYFYFIVIFMWPLFAIIPLAWLLYSSPKAN
jgi:hypothetical protein